MLPPPLAVILPLVIKLVLTIIVPADTVPVLLPNTVIPFDAPIVVVVAAPAN